MANKIKIALVGGKYARNCGDALIFESTKYLLSLAAKERNVELDIVEVDHFAAKKAPKPIAYPQQSLAEKQSDERKSKLKIYRFSPKLSRNIKDIKWYLSGRAEKYRTFIEKELCGVQAVFFAGGGIFKYLREGFHLRNYEIVKYCEKNNILVYFNAVGVEGYGKGCIGCAMLKHIAQSPVVRYITTRDFADILLDKYKTTAKCRRTADPAVWGAKALGIKKDETSQIIGIGVVRGRIFADHGIKISEDKLIEIYKEIIRTLDSEGKEWKLFTTGVKGDVMTALRLLDELGLSRDKLCAPPCSASELLEQISGFSCVIGGRMHACISAYSLGIPAVGFCWNDKLSAFGRQIHREQNFILPKDLDSETVLERLFAACELGYDEKLRSELEYSVKSAVSEMVAGVALRASLFDFGSKKSALMR